MFSVDAHNKVTLSRGDTGTLTIIAHGYTFSDDDRAVFTVRNSVGTVVKEEVYELEDGTTFEAVFENNETDQLKPGSYKWDVRYVIQPYYDQGGRIISGAEVITPNAPMDLELVPVVGEV